MESRVKEVLDDTKKTLVVTANTYGDETLKNMQLGLMLASALAWTEVMKSVVSKFVKSGSGVFHTTVYAMVVTFIAALVSVIAKPKKQPVLSV